MPTSRPSVNWDLMASQLDFTIAPLSKEAPFHAYRSDRPRRATCPLRRCSSCTVIFCSYITSAFINEINKSALLITKTFKTEKYFDSELY